MPAILPIRDLKNTAKISELCRQTDTPIFITKNGYGDMVTARYRRVAHDNRNLALQFVLRQDYHQSKG